MKHITARITDSAGRHVPATQENPLAVPMQATYFRVSENINLVVTNTINGSPVDVWVLLEEVTEEMIYTSEKMYRFIDIASTQTEALEAASRYANIVYGKDIDALGLPL